MNIAKGYVHNIDRFSDVIGIITMYMIYLMIGVLLFDAVTRNILNIPQSWCLEFVQFVLAGYYIVGGAYSLRLGDHVRMDLLYNGWSPKTKARVDFVTDFAMLFYLVVLLIGSISSLQYAIETDEHKFSMWNPSMIPIKAIMLFGLGLMILQTISIVIKDFYRARGQEIEIPPTHDTELFK